MQVMLVIVPLSPVRSVSDEKPWPLFPVYPVCEACPPVLVTFRGFLFIIGCQEFDYHVPWSGFVFFGVLIFSLVDFFFF